tara:strand:- start:15 stop:170 length:156 start_codon:yes stop_codon:yes gene_type:complete
MLMLGLWVFLILQVNLGQRPIPPFDQAGLEQRQAVVLIIRNLIGPFTPQAG